MNLLTKKVSALFAGAIVGAVMLAVFAAPAAAASVDELEDQIAALLAQLSALEGDDDSSEATATGNGYIHHPNVDYMFNTNLYLGDRGTDVMMLQKALNDGGYTVASTGAGSAGNETEYFGPATLQAVKAFQAANNISPVLGYFYPLTRAEMNRKGSVDTGDDEDEDEDDDDSSSADATLDVDEGDNPDDDFMPAGVILMPVTTFEVTAEDGDVEIESVTVLLTGRADDASFDSVVLLDEDGNIIGDEDSFDSDDEAEIGGDYTIEEGETMEFTVAVNASAAIAEEDDGDEFVVEVIEIETDADVKGLPVEGATMTVDDEEDLGDVDVDMETENITLEVGETDELFATVQIDANPDDNDDSVYVMSLRLENTGTGDLDDLDNFYVEVDGDKYDGEVVEDDYLVFDFGDDGFEIEDGDTEDFEVYADVANGEAGDTYEFDIENNFDVHALDEEGYGLPVNVTENAGPVTISAGDVTLNSDDEIDDDEVSIGDDIAIGSFTLEVEGEGVDIDDIVLTIDVVDGGTTDAEDLLLEDFVIEDEDGNVWIDGEDAVWVTSPTQMKVEWENEEADVMDETLFFVKATIQDDVANGTTYDIASLAMTGVEGQTSDDAITVGSVTSWPTMTVEAANVAVSVSSAPTAQNIAENTDDIHFASFKFDLGDSGEDVELDSFDVVLNATGYEGDLDSCEIQVDGEVIDLDSSSDVDQPDDGDTNYTVRFEDPYTLEKDETTTFDLYCDLGSSTVTNTFQWDLSGTATDVDLEGVTTNNDVTATLGDLTGQTMTVTNADVQVSEDSTSPSTRLVVAGTEVVLGVLEVEAEDGDITIDEIAATLYGESTAIFNELVEVYVDGSKVADLNYNGTDDSDDVDGLSIDVEDDETVLIEFRAEISPTGDGDDGADGAELHMEVTLLDTTETAVTVTLNPDPVVFDAVYTFATVPTLAEVSFTEDDLAGGENTALMFSVTADDAEDLTMGSVLLDVSGDAANVTNTKVEVFSDSSLSNKVTVGSLNSFEDATAGVGAKQIDFVDGTEYLEVTAGETYYFRVTIDMSSVAADESVTVELLEDVAANSGTFAATAGTDNFVWTTEDGEDNDEFFNGFEVEGADSDIKNTLNENN